jgi:hypothetical protein
MAMEVSMMPVMMMMSHPAIWMARRCGREIGHTPFLRLCEMKTKCCLEVVRFGKGESDEKKDVSSQPWR